MLEFLPQYIKNALEYINMQSVYEIRLRVDKPILLNYQGEYHYLGLYGLVENQKHALYCTREDIAESVYCAGEYSVYSVEEQIKKGFLTAKFGERIGLAGEYVFEKGQPLTIRNFSSLCICVPHEVVNCGLTIYNICMSDRIKNLLLMSSPGLGKTTILREISRLISKNQKKNILICDERGELSVGDIGESCDVLKYSDKATAFDAGIRAMRPDVLITDELSEKDCEAVRKAISAGVVVLASAHFYDMNYVKAPFFPLFDRYVLLDETQIGKIRCIYDENGREIIKEW